MKIKTFGAKHFTGQLPRIEEGFRSLGHEIVEENPDLIYSNDPGGFDDAIKEKAEFKIFNVLDIPEHLFPNYDLKKLDRQLLTADYITCISETTKKQLDKFVDHQADAVIYQPAMPVFPITNCPDLPNAHWKFLIVGRNADANKRNGLATEYLLKYDSLNNLAAVGSEPPSYPSCCDFYGVVPNDILNQFYNSVDYVFSLTKYGGIELSQIEAVLAGKFPIVANDSDVAMEFNPEFACDPTPEGIREKILEIEQNYGKYKEIVERKQPFFQKHFNGKAVAEKIVELVK